MQNTAIVSSRFCVNIIYKVAPYKYIRNYMQGSLLKLNFHRWNILILHNFISYYFYSWLKCFSYVSVGQIAILAPYTVKSSIITVAMFLLFLWIVWSQQSLMRHSQCDRWISVKFHLCWSTLHGRSMGVRKCKQELPILKYSIIIIKYSSLGIYFMSCGGI